jgi:hypothetical protein
MRRAEELTLIYLDGRAGPAEQEELARLVDTDAEARRLFLTLAEIEVVLRGSHPVDVTSQVMDRIFEDRTSRVVCGVMHQVTGLSTLPPRRQPVPASRWWVGAGALATMALAAIFVGAVPLRTRARPPLAAPVRTQAPVVGIVAAADPPALSPVPESLVHLDFEAMGPGAFTGHLVNDDDCARGSRRCLESDRGEIAVAAAGSRLFEYRPNQVLSFDYFADEGTRGLSVLATSRSRTAEASLALAELVHGRWAHAEVRLAELRGLHDRSLPARQAITRLVVSGRGGARFRIDNLAVVAYPQEKLLPTTSALLSLSR